VAELIRPGDVIVSFNWDFMIDLVVEDDPRNLSIAYTYRPHSDSVTLLKPHGSIDWFEEDKSALSLAGVQGVLDEEVKHLGKVAF
jgi:hypothetical protein